MKYFVFSDIHGCYTELIKSLTDAGYDSNNENHKLVFLGDAFDKNREDYSVYLFLKNNIAADKLIWVLGNHDLYLLNVLRSKEINSFCYNTVRNIAFGINPSVRDISECINTLINDGLLELLEKHTYYYFETDNYVLTHAFIPFNKKEVKYDPNWRSVSSKEWNAAINNMKGFKLAIKDKVLVPNKTLVLGHIGAYYGNLTKYNRELEVDSKEFKTLGKKLMKQCLKNGKYFRTFYGEQVIGIDSRCFETGFVNILIIEQ